MKKINKEQTQKKVSSKEVNKTNNRSSKKKTKI